MALVGVRGHNKDALVADWAESRWRRRTMSNAMVVTGGRTLSVFLRRIRDEIDGGRYRHGDFLPSTRDLAERFDISPETARRGLKLLEGQGLLNSAGRAGFRVAGKQSGDARTNRPVAFISRLSPNRPESQPTLNAVFLAFQEAGARRGWPFLGAYGGDGGVEAIVEQLKTGNAWGAVLDTIDAELHEAIARTGLPVVMVNSWNEDSPLSAVLQDNYRGGYLAAAHLLRRGARRIAWIGPVNGFYHSRERFAGAGACLRDAGSHIEDRDCVEAREMLDAAGVRPLLDRSDRPDGILAFGLMAVQAVRDAAAGLGLEIGRDLQLVSWVTEECYDQYYLPIFRGAAPAPAVVWSARDMVDRALSLLAEAADGRIAGSMRVCVPTMLRLAKGEETR